MRDMLFERFKQFTEAEGIDLTCPVLIGISGGVDSIVLADLCDRSGAETVCLHVNYGLRGAESDEDERFVRAFCLRRNLELVVFDARQEIRSEAGGAVQALARSIRYREFVAEAERRGSDSVLLAHHADDQVETVLMSLFRGAGVNGLAGMPVIRSAGDGPVRVVRPLLFARRSEIEAYAAEMGLPWREDTSNTDPKYRRSIVRSEILPLIERHFGASTPDNILRASALARRLAQASREQPESGWRSASGGSTLLAADLEALPHIVRTRRILDALARLSPRAPRTKAVAERIEALLSQQPGRRVDVGGVSVVRERDRLRFLTVEESERDERHHSVSLAVGSSVRVPGGVLFSHRLESLPNAFDAGTRDIEYVDADRFGDAFDVTKWRDGDRISLLGTRGSKKVSDLLTDLKVEPSRRRTTLVVRVGDRVAWVVGLRLSAEFAVRSDTRSVTMLGFVRD